MIFRVGVGLRQKNRFDCGGFPDLDTDVMTFYPDFELYLLAENLFVV